MIRQMRQCGTFVSKNKTVLAHITIWLLLFSVALWDGAKIINDYVNDNCYTLVKLFVSNGTFPFLNNISVGVSVNYYSKSLLEPRVTSGGYKMQSSLAHKDFVDQIVINQTNIGDTPLNTRRAIAALFNEVRLLDKSGFECIANANDKSCSFMSKPYLENLLKNSTYVERLEEDLWTEVQKNIIWRKTMLLDNTKLDITPVYISDTSAFVDIYSSNVLTLFWPSFNYFVGDVVDSSQRRSLYNSSIEHVVGVYINGEEVFPHVHVDEEATVITLQIYNAGVYDKRLTTECVDEPAIYHPDALAKLNRCALRQHLEIVVRECECIPFSYRRQFQIINTKSTYRIVYCTAQIYSRCFAKAQKAFANKPSCPPSCITVKNQYLVSRAMVAAPVMCREDRTDEKLEQVCSLTELVLKCYDLSFTIYEERFQLTSSQLLSQVGGDLGLYTGISILGMWQFLMYIYSLYQNRKKSKARANRNSDNASTGATNDLATSTILAFFNHYFETTNDPIGTDNLNQKLETDVNLETKILDTVKTIMADMKTEMQTQIQQAQMQMQVQMQNIQEVLNELVKKQVLAKADQKKGGDFEEAETTSKL